MAAATRANISRQTDDLEDDALVEPICFQQLGQEPL
jgi:hypothetical protein